jgi:pantoate--beta-alanine ligase
MAIDVESVTRIHSVRERIAEWRRENHKVALVQTMGSLHKGHLAMIAEARKRAPRLAVSVFVNPLQFGPDEDFGRYPRKIEADKEALAEAGADLMFAPSAFEMYPTGFERTTTVDVPELSQILEGATRPTFIEGLCTVTTKLLQIVQPDVAVYGEKDYQPLIIIKRLVADLCVPVEIASIPVVRDHDGLAFGTRNRHLSARDRNIASRLHDALKHARKRLLEGERNFATVAETGLKELDRSGFHVDYLAIRQAADLLPPRADSRDLVVLAAARLGLSRLVDCLHVQLTS